MTSSVGYIFNATTLAAEQVDWPGFPALFESHGTRILRIVFWSDSLARWIAVTPQAVEGSGCLEIAPGDIARMRELQGAMPLTDVLWRVLGVSVALPDPSL